MLKPDLWHSGLSGPAASRPGDKIVEIDGKPTDNIDTEDAIRMKKGADGTKVTLTVVHAGKTKREKFTLTRELVRVETVLGDRRAKDDHWNFMYDEKDSIGYIRITSFSLDTAKELRVAMEDLKKPQASRTGSRSADSEPRRFAPFGHRN